MPQLIYLWNRLQEPSTRASLLAALAYFHVNPEALQSYEGLAAVAIGAIGVFVGEGKPAAKVAGFNQ
jgi:hypothetical protein